MNGMAKKVTLLLKDKYSMSPAGKIKVSLDIVFKYSQKDVTRN